MQRRTLILAGGLAGLAVFFGVLFFGCGKPPQMGANEEVFKAVDELYTAVTSRKEDHLSKCEKRLAELNK